MSRYLKLLSASMLLSVLVVGLAGSAHAAQTPTGTIAGRVTDTDGGVVGGATVSVESPSLQGIQKTTTTPNGDYIFKFLPPGRYTVTVNATGFAPNKVELTIGATQPATLDVIVAPAAVAESVDVVAEATSFPKAVMAAANLKATLLQDLPTARTFLSAVDLSPSVHATGPGGARSIAGAMSFESVYMLNGVQVQDNIRGTPLNLFIEDAIQETTTTTSGVSAEYGRFLGGVVNAITKSGGNALSGSFRTTFANDDWRTVSPFGEPKSKATVPTYEFTVGGPIVKDRTWFFGAGRMFNQTLSRETAFTRVPYEAGTNERRFEGKLTQSLSEGHRLEVAYTGIQREEKNNAFPSVNEVMDLRALTTREIPQSVFSTHYAGSLSQNFFIEGQYSFRRESFDHDGGTNKDLLQGTPLIDNQTGAWWWAPSFCGVCGGEQRNNEDMIVKGSYFKSTSRGAHNITFGYDMFNDKRKGDNRQSATDYHVYASGSVISNGTVYPIFEPGFSAFVVYWPLLESSKGTNFRTHSLFVSDEWAANKHVSLTLGARWDKNHGRDAGGNLIADDSILSPRLGVVFDPKGDGRTTFNASASRYVAALAGSIAEGATPAGVPSILAYAYFGDPINDNPTGPFVAPDVALQQVFNWYNASGGETIVQATIPGLTVKVPRSLKSPHADEVAAGMSQELGSRGSVRFDVVRRKFADFYGSRIDTTTGQAEDEFGQVFDVEHIVNTDAVKRTYTAFTAQADYRPATDLTLGASYTLSHLRGNINGENSGSGPIPTGILQYPEYGDPKWMSPIGHLSADQRHRARIWGLYNMPIGDSPNTLSVGVIEQLQSGTPYGAVGSILMADESGHPFVNNPGYSTPLDTQTYYFTPRDEFTTKTMVRTDLSINYMLGLGSGGQRQFFAQAQILNLFNQFQLFNMSTNAINTTVLTAIDDPTRFLPFNPFTQTPVRGVHWDYGSKFGTPTGSGAYTLPRTFTFTTGIRF